MLIMPLVTLLCVIDVCAQRKTLQSAGFFKQYRLYSPTNEPKLVFTHTLQLNESQQMTPLARSLRDLSFGDQEKCKLRFFLNNVKVRRREGRGRLL